MRHSSQRDNYKQNKRFYETLESLVFSRVFFFCVAVFHCFVKIVVK